MPKKPAPAPLSHHQLKPALRIGKTGITEETIKKLTHILKKNKTVKVKFLASAIQDNKKQLAEQLADSTNTKIIHRVGFVVVLTRKS